MICERVSKPQVAKLSCPKPAFVPGFQKKATEPGNSAQASRQSARSSLTTLPTALAPIGLMTVPGAIRWVVPLIDRPARARVGQPHSLMLAAIAATWASVWVRAFLAYGISRSIAHRSTLSAGHGL